MILTKWLYFHLRSFTNMGPVHSLGSHVSYNTCN